jgi:hypothetical protein
MIRGTTAHFRFALPCSCADVQAATITFWQEFNNGPAPQRPLPIVKVLAQCTMSYSTNEICVTLTPEETARFVDTRKAYAQMTSTTIEGSRVASLPHELTVYPIHSSAESDEVIPTPGYDGIIFLDGGEL